MNDAVGCHFTGLMDRTEGIFLLIGAVFITAHKKQDGIRSRQTAGYWVCQDLWELPGGYPRGEVPGAKRAAARVVPKGMAGRRCQHHLERGDEMCLI